MRRSLVSGSGGVMRVVVAAAAVGAVLASGRVAHAHGDFDKERRETGPAAASEARGGAPEGGEAAEGEEEREPRRLKLDVDLVIGFGKTEIVSQDLPGSFGTTPATRLGEARTQTESLILSAGYGVTRHVTLGARLPLTYGSFAEDGRQSRGAGAVGNVELEAEYERELTERLGFVFALGIALPTAQGNELPSADEATRLGPSADLDALDRFALNRAAASSRGFEENALYEPKHLGVIPKVGLEIRVGKLQIDPYVKLESLFATTKDQPHSYTGELVLGARAAYRVASRLDLGVRAWANVPVSGSDVTTVVAVEPEARLHLGSWTPRLGVIVPVAGPLTDPRFVGVRLGLAASF